MGWTRNHQTRTPENPAQAWPLPPCPPPPGTCHSRSQEGRELLTHGAGTGWPEARSPPRSAFPPHRETEGPHLGLTHEHRHGEEMLTHTTMHAPSAPHHTGTRAKPHLPGCGRTPRGSLPSARGPARSHACRSPASGPPAAHWERIRRSLGSLPTSTVSPPTDPKPWSLPPPHQASGILACQGPQRASPGFMPTDVSLCMCVSMCGCVSGYMSVCFSVYVSM